MIKIILPPDQGNQSEAGWLLIFTGTYYAKVSTLQPKNSGSQSILCVIDFSDSSEQVLQWSVDMAKKLNVQINIIHPYRLNQSEKKEDMISVKKNIDMEATKNFQKISKNIFKDGSVAYDFRAEVGFLYDRVQDHLKKNSTQLIVIGKKIANDKTESLDELIKRAEVPLVIIPK